MPAARQPSWHDEGRSGSCGIALPNHVPYILRGMLELQLFPACCSSFFLCLEAGETHRCWRAQGLWQICSSFFFFFFFITSSLFLKKFKCDSMRAVNFFRIFDMCLALTHGPPPQPATGNICLDASWQIVIWQALWQMDGWRRLISIFLLHSYLSLWSSWLCHLTGTGEQFPFLLTYSQHIFCGNSLSNFLPLYPVCCVQPYRSLL